MKNRRKKIPELEKMVQTGRKKFVRYEEGAMLYSMGLHANPYTPTNFYHKTDDCKFIRRVPKEELLIFDSEEAAIQNGRFINRCRECFSKDG